MGGAELWSRLEASSVLLPSMATTLKGVAPYTDQPNLLPSFGGYDYSVADPRRPRVMRIESDFVTCAPHRHRASSLTLAL